VIFTCSPALAGSAEKFSTGRTAKKMSPVGRASRDAGRLFGAEYPCSTITPSTTVATAPTVWARMRPTNEIHAERTLSFFFFVFFSESSIAGPAM
jgi:hypothetical protein